ncbi:ROK family protein [Paenibacillus albilobatus]|nr:ROK family protein [Paenibacillus albilobatus]
MMKVIGIDIGGTSIKGMVLDGAGRLLHHGKIKTDAREGKGRILANVLSLLDTLLEHHADVQGIGVGTAGRVNVRSGEVVYATDNLPGWQGTNVKAVLEQARGLPVFVDNDVNAALAGEAWLGAGRDLDDVSMLTLGTGVGGANMIEGKLFRGAHWNGGEFGHTILVPGGLPCNCGLRGCMEQYLSGTALVRAASEAAGRSYASGMEVLDDYVKGVPQTADVMKRFAEHLAIAVNHLHLGLNPQAIILGGGLIDSQRIWWPLLTESMANLKLNADVRPALLGNKAGAIGAARLVFQHLQAEAAH